MQSKSRERGSGKEINDSTVGNVTSTTLDSILTHSTRYIGKTVTFPAHVKDKEFFPNPIVTDVDRKEILAMVLYKKEEPSTALLAAAVESNAIDNLSSLKEGDGVVITGSVGLPFLPVSIVKYGTRLMDGPCPRPSIIVTKVSIARRDGP